ncbi:hypothetical protein ACLOAU_14265 [Niabella sp. CJ426]|jgi:hypothetical protein|uniref:hypothetical protein n=1 Tax=Niabella sp. CJ426 TaxID=3393740 RepID=UPI003D04F9A9
MAGLKLTLILCVIPIMLIGGIYTYRFLNNKLTSSSSTFGLIFYALALFCAMAAIYGGGLTAIALLYDYLSI